MNGLKIEVTKCTKANFCSKKQAPEASECKNCMSFGWEAFELKRTVSFLDQERQENVFALVVWRLSFNESFSRIIIGEANNNRSYSARVLWEITLRNNLWRKCQARPTCSTHTRSRWGCWWRTERTCGPTSSWRPTSSQLFNFINKIGGFHLSLECRIWCFH